MLRTGSENVSNTRQNSRSLKAVGRPESRPQPTASTSASEAADAIEETRTDRASYRSVAVSFATAGDWRRLIARERRLWVVRLDFQQAGVRLARAALRRGSLRVGSTVAACHPEPPRPVSLGPRAVGWPASEVAALNTARIAGKSDAEIRDLVASLQAARTAA